MILFKNKLHRQYFAGILNHPLPTSIDSSRLTMSYFALSGLDILKGLDSSYKERFVDWVYSLQSTEENFSGFQNSSSFTNIKEFKWGHIAATYSALNILIILGDDLKRVDRKAILKSLKLLQLDDGSFTCTKEPCENDMRFVYCAVSISYILNDWSGINIEKTISYILNSISYDGGMGQGPHLESHGGSTYCGIASLSLMNQMHRIGPQQKKSLIYWIMKRQFDGFQGRPNKIADTCYTFWIGATLQILNAYQFINVERLQNFVMSTQDFRQGGFGKWVGYRTDPLHTYFSLAGMSFILKDDLNEIVPELNITRRAYEHLKCLHKFA